MRIRGRQGVRIVLAGVALLILAGCSDGDGGGDDGPFVRVGGDDPAYLGIRVIPPPEKPEADFTDTAGKPFDLRAETEGYLTLLFFGYTHCPDVCPTQMATIATALKQLAPEERERVKVVFVTTDPERDTPGVLRDWLDAFDTAFIGLQAGADELERLQANAGMAPAATLVDGANTAGSDGHEDVHDDYAVLHGEFVLAFTPDDNLAHTIYALDATVDVYVHDIEKLLREGWRGE